MPEALISALLMTEAFTITALGVYEAYRFVRLLIRKPRPDDECYHPCFICEPRGMPLDTSPPLLLSPPPGGTHEDQGTPLPATSANPLPWAGRAWTSVCDFVIDSLTKLR